MDLVKKSVSSSDLEKKGKTLIKNNDFYKDIARMFSDQQNREFFEKYFSDSIDSAIMIKIAKLCIYFFDKYSKQTGTDLNMEAMISVIHSLLTDSESRRTFLVDPEFEQQLLL